MTTPTPLTNDQLLDYFEGTLSDAAAALIEQRLASDPAAPAARATLAEWQSQNAAITALYQPLAAEPLPDRLTAVIRKAEAADAARAAPPRLWLVAAAIALLGIGIAGGWFARDLAAISPQAQSVAVAAMQAYDTYVVEVAHPVEVLASDAAHLNAWMSKRLGHETRPPDFAAAGFTLLGGRIVPSNEGAAALYMYENAEGQRVTLYIAPQGAATTTAFQFAQAGTTQSFYWMDRDLSYAVVGDIARETLRRIALSAYDQLI